ncbi:xylose/arabinose ABC transporter ATP-binding protein XylG [Sulfolobus acidocaldarius]|uniref:Xylose/arabinose import ATP-binding protein XylG n=4 Tax=Sulfolobus acidocaldarius TaxID=2285 RepID=XYLG_SULAC|nr:xylose/arabinose ABC transporter ATP-binding protein XylG [Sulfolobus acidocaldarius]P0DTT6.1 RecName: Full=Xylose/arabinose import ATP-binding protein XylG [Sulfolobus acidocaldarius DSM 639]AGE72013.1 ABC transporter related protein [Sulfolobus acidocaldarius N8]AGE74330.1 ABC transporter related protein [Sulfolobus acidocaldarius Ron12/I]ALU29796.1 ABC transporter ATP-binding protein [Sulfolobus acidocaldarius]ALU32534.1 ABC transporter ATP-binding protein [Sulfolobus acidocaldarius]WCM
MSDLLEIRDVHKSFGAVKALDGVSMEINKGEVVALLGDNGAGKSTLIKIISGYHKPDRGDLVFEGKKVIFNSPNDARSLGIETIYQDLALIPDLPIYYNIFLAREVTNKIFLNKKKMMEESKKLLDSLQIRIPDINMKVENLSGGQRQAVAVARAVYFSAKMILMDEPTAALSVVEARKVLELARNLKKKGLGVLIITHNIIQGYEVADRIYVLDRGKIIFHKKKEETNVEEITEVMTSFALGKVNLGEKR